jgi:large subunit ribosomal protein L25
VPQIAINAEARSDFGKGAARRLRRDGQIPAVIYGQGTELLHVALPSHELSLALKSKGLVLEVTGAGNGALVAPREIQKDPVKNTIDHIDLVVLSADELAARLA